MFRWKLSKADRAARLGRLLDDVERQLEAGDAVDLASVQCENPELMPELGDRLQALEHIDSAVRRAEQIQATEGCSAPAQIVENIVADELALLRQALPEYDLWETLRHGGQGIVFKALERATGRTVAIKILLEGPLASERQRQRFNREMELISRLGHPNVVTLYSSGVVHGRPYFTMEYIDGLPIDDYALLRDLSAREIVGLFVTICHTLTYAHQRGIIHRDLKPSNILVDADGKPHVLDFGLAKDIVGSEGVGASERISMPGCSVGTLPYLSPEQVDATGDVDTRSDVYALGIVLFEVLSGRFPYPVDEDPRSVRQNILNQEPARLRDVMSTAEQAGDPAFRAINDDLEAVLLKSLEKDKSARYQSMADFADDLQRYLAGEAVRAKAHRRFYVLRRTLRKYRVHTAVAACFLVVVASASILVTGQWLRARVERDNARDSARIARETAQVAHTSLSTVLNDVIEELTRLPGGIAARDRILMDVADDLDRLGSLIESNEGMAELRAAWYLRRGDVARIQGRLTEAADHYRRLVDIKRERVRTDDSMESGIELIEALTKLAMESDDWAPSFGEAITIGEALIAAFPAQPELIEPISGARLGWAKRLLNAGNPVAAATQIEEATRLAEPMLAEEDIDDSMLELIADIYMVDGCVSFALGRADVAAASFERSLRMATALLDDRPLDTLRVRWVMNAAMRLGDLKQDAGQLDLAESLFTRAVSLGEEFSERDSQNAIIQVTLYSSYHYLVNFYRERAGQGDVLRADEYSMKALRAVRDLVAADSRNQRWRNYLGMALKLRGKSLLESGHAADAYDHLTEALAQFETLRAEGLDDAVAAHRISFTHEWLGMACGALGRHSEELQHHRTSYELRKANHDANPSVFLFATPVIVSQRTLGQWYFNRNTPEDDLLSDEWYASAQASLRALFESGDLAGREAEFQRWLDQANDRRGQLADRLARLSGE
ncbi:MAG: serine/threonine protein kinase [Planctomycetes bacterium]|nr:serine/threonine protein kinase [Planctomycetota bacterium]